MNTLEGLLASVLSKPHEETYWLVLSDWLQENDDPRRGELLQLHRRMIRTCCEAHKHPQREDWQARIAELLALGVYPCVPQHALNLPAGILLTGSFIPPGSFRMGGNANRNEMPIHTVKLTKGFFMGIHPVTQEQWEAVMGNNPSRFKSPNRPVDCVSFHDCQDFCNKLTTDLATVQLPTEAEWEYACRAGTTTEYHFGNLIDPEWVNYDGRETWNGSSTGKYREQTTDVGTFAANAWGLFDVHGNVREWCEPVRNPYTHGEIIDPSDHRDPQYPALRGGCWLSYPDSCRSAYRIHRSSTVRDSNYGFRVCFRLR